jgi:hypothetical protein
VLELIAHLALPIPSTDLYEALLERLEERSLPLPAGQGLRYGSLAAEFYNLLTEWLPPQHPALAERAKTLLKTGPFPRAHLAFAAHEGESVDELVAALRRTPDLDVDPYLAVFALTQAIQRAPQRAVEVAKILSEVKTSQELRELVSRETARICPDWHGQFGTGLRDALGLPA